MTITDSGSHFIFDDGKQSRAVAYGLLQIKTQGSHLVINSSTNLQSLCSVDYADITLVNIAAVTDADSLSTYLMSK